MKQIIDDIISSIESCIELEKRSYPNPNDIVIPKAEIRILGQFALILDEEANSNLLPVATMDVDAIINAKWFIKKALADRLQKYGLEYDELSDEIWIPDNAHFVTYYDSNKLNVSYLDPISALTSKAIKAKEKNRLLIKKALDFYKERLESQIERYGGQVEYFK